VESRKLGPTPRTKGVSCHCECRGLLGGRFRFGCHPTPPWLPHAAQLPTVTYSQTSSNSGARAHRRSILPLATLQPGCS
jgi:hypothetical protein